MKQSMAYILIVSGLIALGFGIYLLASNKQHTVVQEIRTNKDTAVAQPRRLSNNFDEENKTKGDEFEKFIVQQFGKKYFTLQEWRSDKYVNGVYALSNHFPDLEIKFSMGNIVDSFAVECKWRKNYYKNGIEWAGDYQVDNYKAYADEMQIPVFIVIGLGGLPRQPEKIFSIPLAQLKTNSISKENLRKYEKKNTPFYWDEKKKQLR